MLPARHKCPACFKQYKKKEHLVEHMKTSYHSVHQPKCGICKKHCKSLESVREHLTGPLAKGSCAEIFKIQGCSLCLRVLGCSGDLAIHKDRCRLLSTNPLVLSKDLKELSLMEKMAANNGIGSKLDDIADRQQMVVVELSECQEGMLGNAFTRAAAIADNIPEVVAMDCEMVGGGSDGSLDFCARVCLIDENEHIVFHSFVKPQIPVTDYRFETTGLSEEDLAKAPSLELIRWKIEEILYNKESISTARLSGGRARILVGHELEHDLDCLRLNYPAHLIRDTAHYPPLMKTNLVSHSLKYLANTYLGYDIQSTTHNPYEDAVAALRIYKRMRCGSHLAEACFGSNTSYNSDKYGKNTFTSFQMSVLENKSPEELLEMSCCKYKCWCLDTRQVVESSEQPWPSWEV